MNSFWDFFWFIISFFLLMAYLMVLFQIVGDIFRDRSSSGVAKAVWIFCLIFFPVLTALVYLVTKGQAMTERNLAQAHAAQSEAETYIRSVSAGAGSPSDEIGRAKALLDAGTISEDEYQALKAKALA